MTNLIFILGAMYILPVIGFFLVLAAHDPKNWLTYIGIGFAWPYILLTDKIGK